MSASKFLHFGTYFFRTTSTHKILSPIPPFLSFQPSPSLSLHFRRSISSATVADDNPQETLLQQHHPWPEWVSFVDRLKTGGYFIAKDDHSNNIATDANTSSSSTDSVVYTDINQLRDPCLSFARDRYDVFKSLSLPDIQTLVQGGCPNILRKTVNSAKRLRAYAQLDEAEVCGACDLRGSCDRAYKLLSNNEADARTVDIVRILMFYALDPLVISGGEKHPSRELVEASARKLLSELIELSVGSTASALPKPTAEFSLWKEQHVNFGDDNLSKDVEMRRGDWICPKCNFMNFAKNLRCLKCKEEGPKKVVASDIEMKKGDWMCSKCNFMNFSRNKICLKCKAEAPKKISDVEMKKGDWICSNCDYMNFSKNKVCLRCREPRPIGRPGEWRCPSCDFLNFSRNSVCMKCDCAQPKEALSEYEKQIWKSPS